MKILQINAVYRHGSTGTIVRDIEQLCEQNGMECYVASPDPKVREAKRGYVIGNTLDHKLHALLCRINGRQAYYSHIPTWKLCRFIDRIKPDVVHLHNLHSNYIHLNLLLRHLTRRDIRTIVTLHDCWYYTGGCFHYTQANCFKWKESCGNCPKKKTDTPAYFLDKSSQILADRKRFFDAVPDLIVTGVSSWICEESKKGIFRDKNVVTIYNGIDTSIFSPTTLQDIKPKDALLRVKTELSGHFTIMGLAVKWLDPINREAFHYILNQMEDNDRFLLFGCDEVKLNILNSLNISENKVITFGYTTNRQQLAALYTLADVFVNCTREESFSLINVEPQACGTPVVTYANTGAQETVNNKCGFGVPTCDYRTMWEKITLIRKKGKAHFSNDCIQWVKDFFEMQLNYKRYINLYNSNKTTH